MYVCTHVRMYACTYVCMHACMYACMCVWACACVHARVHVCMYAAAPAFKSQGGAIRSSFSSTPTEIKNEQLSEQSTEAI